ncbi:uncharacterized protein LOC113358834 isoform X4 [Papaver somniferum]|uniref:uncharacterized protein LOC113358834 isoform X4 n=1 Tax=Papaver somniferum TaxID=3469 RepID=UPI000E7040E8|nr:uncharacterized protein LOC113358834 isoform X4 [Papaver somniferum]
MDVISRAVMVERKLIFEFLAQARKSKLSTSGDNRSQGNLTKDCIKGLKLKNDKKYYSILAFSCNDGYMKPNFRVTNQKNCSTRSAIGQPRYYVYSPVTKHFKYRLLVGFWMSCACT